jgi:hypothetical protein
MLKNLWPSLLAVLQEEAGVEFDTAGDLEFGGLAVLVADLEGLLLGTWMLRYAVRFLMLMFEGRR